MEYTEMLFADMPRIERPIDKMIRYGASEKLTNADLLSIMLRADTEAVARRVLRTCPVPADLAARSLSDLKAAGLDEAQACELLAAFELGRRLLGGKKAGIYLKPRDIWEELRDIREAKKEHFVVFYLDTRNQEIKRDIVSIGTLNCNLVHPREVFEPAVRNLAASVIVAHNHPSGCLEPSDEDLSLTKRLSQAGKLLGIELLDHVIVAKGGFMSFKEKGLL